MLRTRFLSSARARFAATAATVLALVALGGVTAAPAAADVNVRVNVTVEGVPYANQSLQFQPPGYGAYTVTTDVSGGFGWGGPGWPDGDYRIFPPGNSSIYVTPALLTLSSSDYNVYVDFQRYQVGGSIPADAASGATTVQIEENNSGTWNAVGSGTVSSASGDFQFYLPDGPNEYRLRFTPDSSTPYIETDSSAFTIDGSLALYDLGAVSLLPARTISGTVVTDAGSTALAGATVTASIAGSDVASATTDGSGNYRILLPVSDASYTVRAEAAGFTTQEWDATSAGDETVAVNATDGYARTGIDFALVGLPVVISGSLLYYHLLDATPQVSLYSGGATPTLIEAQATIVPNGLYGDFSFPAVPAGDYFIKVVPDDDDPFLPTLLGDSGYTEWSLNSTLDAAFSAAHSFSVSATVPSSGTGHDLNLTTVEAAYLIGLLQAPGSDDPIQGCVQVTDVLDPSLTLCAPTDGDGHFSAKVPLGESFTLEALPSSNRYLSQWWWSTQDPAEAIAVGPATARGFYGSYTFYIGLAPATINLDAADVTALDPITAHLFYRSTGTTNWFPVATAATDPAHGSTALSFGDLDDGEYRLRFQDSNGMWLAATTYDSGVEPDGTTTSGPACFIDLFDVADGAPNFVNATFDSGNQTEECGEQQYEYGTLDGRVISSPDFGSEPVDDHLVRISDSGTIRAVTTEADGTFHLDYLPNSTYSVQVLPTAHVAGEHEYRYYADELALGNGNVDLGDLVATRYGNVTGTITNWAAAGTTGTVTVYREDECGCWSPGPLSVEIEADGSFEVPGIDLDGQYAMRVDFDSDWAPVFLGGGYPEPVSPFTGTAEQDFALGDYDVDLVEYVTISGYVTFGATPVDDGYVIVFPEGDDGSNAAYGPTGVDGYYEIQVVPNVDYELVAIPGDPGVKIQGYGGYNFSPYYTGELISDLVEVETDSVEDINFALVAVDEVAFDLELSDPDVDVHLFTKIAGAWTQVDTFTSDEDDYAYTEVVGDGEYRLEFSSNGVRLAVHDVYSELYYPYVDYVDDEDEFSPAACYLELGELAHGSYYYAEISLVTAPVGSECGEAAPVLPPASGKPSTVKPKGDSITVSELLEVIDEEDTPTTEPSTGGGEGEQPDETDVDGSDAASTPDITWVFWLSGILVLVIVACGVVYVVRRR